MAIQQWHYVCTRDNPADHAFGGLNADELEVSGWFNGLSFLWEEGTLEKEQIYNIPPDDPEVRMIRALSTTVAYEHLGLKIWNRFSDWTQMVGVVSLILKYLHRKRGHSLESVEAVQ